MARRKKAATPSTDLRPPFEPGNVLAIKHGAYSPRVVTPIAEEILTLLLGDDDVRFLRGAAMRPELWRYAHRQARVELLRAALDEHSEDCTACEKCISLEERWQRADAEASKSAMRLGLDPLARAQIMRELPDLREQEARDRGSDALHELMDAIRDRSRRDVLDGREVDDGRGGFLTADSLSEDPR